MRMEELTNNEKRKEFLENYSEWDLWLDVPEVSEQYYKYRLPNDSIIVVKETEHASGRYYFTTEYYLLEGDWKRFADCKKSKSDVVDYLRKLKG